MQTSLIKSHVSIIKETTFFTDTFYAYNSNLYSSLIWWNFCVLLKHMYKSSCKCIVLWGRNISDLVHTWRFNYTYEFSWKWINILCSSNSCFFCFAKQMISEVWTAYGAIWMLNVSKKVADLSNLSLFSPIGVWLHYFGILYMDTCYWCSAGKCMQSHQHHVKRGKHCIHFYFSFLFHKFAMVLLRRFVWVEGNAFYGVKIKHHGAGSQIKTDASRDAWLWEVTASVINVASCRCMQISVWKCVSHLQWKIIMVLLMISVLERIMWSQAAHRLFNVFPY